jgi:hypothetical protein
LDLPNFIKFSQKINHKEGAFTSALCDLIKNFKYCKNDADQVQNDNDPTNFNQPVIGAIKEALRGQLTLIASNLLNSEHSKLEDLSVEEQNLWKSFHNSDIYEFITGEQRVGRVQSQNFNSTRLNHANSLFTCLLEWSSLLTRTSNLLKIKTDLQGKLRKLLLNLYSLLNLCNHLFYLHNL